MEGDSSKSHERQLFNWGICSEKGVHDAGGAY